MEAAQKLISPLDRRQTSNIGRGLQRQALIWRRVNSTSLMNDAWSFIQGITIISCHFSTDLAKTPHNHSIVRLFTFRSDFFAASLLVPTVRQLAQTPEGGRRGRVAIPADRRYRTGQSSQQPHRLAAVQIVGWNLSARRPTQIHGLAQKVHVVQRPVETRLRRYGR